MRWLVERSVEVHAFLWHTSLKILTLRVSTALNQEEGPLLCYFNQHFKIDPATFQVCVLSSLLILSLVARFAFPLRALVQALSHCSLHQKERKVSFCI
eukprot:82045-Rhodomonas_salina.7